MRESLGWGVGCCRKSSCELSGDHKGPEDQHWGFWDEVCGPWGIWLTLASSKWAVLVKEGLESKNVPEAETA